MLLARVVKLPSSAGLILREEVACEFALTEQMMDRLQVHDGEQVMLSEAPGGGYRITPYQRRIADDIGTIDEIIAEDHDLLKELAK